MCGKQGLWSWAEAARLCRMDTNTEMLHKGTHCYVPSDKDECSIKTNYSNCWDYSVI